MSSTKMEYKKIKWLEYQENIKFQLTGKEINLEIDPAQLTKQ